MLKIAVLLALFGAAFGAGNSTSAMKNSTITSTVAPSHSVIHNSSATSHSTAKPSTSTVFINSSHTSHSMAPTSPSVTRTSTVSPATSTAVPTTTPRPTTMPPYAKFDVHNKAGNYCIVAHFEGTFTVKYEKNETSNNTTQEKVVVELNRTTEFNMDGSLCEANNSKLVISWPKEKYYFLVMEFKREFGKSESWKVSTIMMNVTLTGNKAFQNATVSAFRGMTNKSDIVGGKSQNYVCNELPHLELGNKKSAVQVDITLKKLQIEPFVNKKKPEFDSNHKECSADNPTTAPASPSNDIVPIAVGCALAGLVLIVLIAYIIGRRKSHSGYEKV